MKCLSTTLLFLACAAPAAAADTAVPYPEGYRDWRHLKSMVIEDGHPLYAPFGGIHHLYANDKAVRGYKKGKFPDGSVIVFDLLEAQRADNAVTEGARRVTGVMHKDAKKFASTGGWGFEGFAGDSKTERAVGANAATACYACHTSQQDHDYVFSRMRD
ncbi:MAG: cytochrome P460 family protein [Gammaproteobacteria bacterium]|nr:cytochrome P460 family protein [Gammaproteobacteria bacterium]